MNEHVCGLAPFLYGILELIKQKEAIPIDVLDTKLAAGVASYLSRKYERIFSAVGFSLGDAEIVDALFRQWHGVADGKEKRQYCSEKNDGLYLLLKLAINKLF